MRHSRRQLRDAGGADAASTASAASVTGQPASPWAAAPGALAAARAATPAASAVTSSERAPTASVSTAECADGTVSRVHFVMCPHHDVDPRRWRKVWGLSNVPEFTYTADDFRSKCASFAAVIRGWFAELLPVPIYIEPVTCLSNEASVNLFARSKYVIAGGAAPSSSSRSGAPSGGVRR